MQIWWPLQEWLYLIPTGLGMLPLSSEERSERRNNIFVRSRAAIAASLILNSNRVTTAAFHPDSLLHTLDERFCFRACFS